MRFNALALLTGAMLLGACGGGDATTDTSSTVTGDTAVTTTPPTGSTTTAAPGGTTAPGGTAATPAPATGTTHTVRMVLEGTTYKFDPANITIKAGDAVKWVMISGAPHNVAFQNVPADVKGQLDANMPNTPQPKLGELTGPMLMNANEEYTVSFANIKPGTYDYLCQPHIAMAMTGKVTVQ
jgi:plastocyanin